MNFIKSNIDIDKNMRYALGINFHVVFWCIMLGYYFYSMDLFGSPFEFSLRLKLFYFPFQLFAAYFMLFVLLGQYLYKGKYIKAIIGFVFFIFFTSYFAYFIFEMVVAPYFDPEFVIPEIKAILINIEFLISQHMRAIFISPMILICLEFGVSQYQKMKDVEDLIIQKNRTELRLLKTQIHPNFLLSTLRNLEKLTAQNDQDGPVVIERLSETLDYILYKGRQENIELQKEIEALKEYVALENIRFKNITKINFEEKISDKTKSISPLILFSFLEYNFKGYTQENIPFSNTNISICEVENKLQCKIVNSNIKHKETAPFLFEIGTMKRQLDISYPAKYQIETSQGQDYYQINLALEL